MNRERLRREAAPIASYTALCRELAGADLGELDTTGARSVARRYSAGWFESNRRKRRGEKACYPRRKRRLFPVRWYHGTFRIEGRRVRIPTARGSPRCGYGCRVTSRIAPSGSGRSPSSVRRASCRWTSPPRSVSRSMSWIRRGWRGWMWGSSTRSPSRPRMRRWSCRGARFVPSRGCNLEDARQRGKDLGRKAPKRGSVVVAGGTSCARDSASRRRGTVGGSARRIIRRPSGWWRGRLTARSVRS